MKIHFSTCALLLLDAPSEILARRRYFCDLDMRCLKSAFSFLILLSEVKRSEANPSHMGVTCLAFSSFCRFAAKEKALYVPLKVSFSFREVNIHKLGPAV